MKIYSCPDECPAPEPDYNDYDSQKEQAAEAKHIADLKLWLTKRGHTGKYTGEIVSFGVGDGAAQYMLADGPKSFLIHLPYGDAYQYRGIEHFPKAAIVKQIEQARQFAKMFGR